MNREPPHWLFKERGWEKRVGTCLILGRLSIWTLLLLCWWSEGQATCACVNALVVPSVFVCPWVHLFVVCKCAQYLCVHIPPTDRIQNLYISIENRSRNSFFTVNQVTVRAICQCAHLTTGFVMEINLIWIQSDSLLHSVQWSEEWCLVAAIDLQSKSDSHQTDAPSLSLPTVRQGHWTGLTHRKKHRLVLIGFKLASSPTGPSPRGWGTERVMERGGEKKMEDSYHTCC